MVISEVEGVRVVSISGSFDIGNAPEVSSELYHAAAGQRALVVVLERCRRIDIDAIASLVALHRRFGDRLVLVGAAHHRAFQTACVDKVFRMEPTVDDAVRYLNMLRSNDENILKERSPDKRDEDPKLV